MPTLTTKQDASDLGLTRFYTGRACGRGHDSERLTSSGACVKCMNEDKAARSKTRAFKDQRNAQLIAKRAAAREMRTCLVCQTPFDIMIDNRLGAKTCSPSCGEALQEQRQADRLKKPDRECEQCFSLFASRKPGQQCCSPKCGIALRDERRAARTKTCIQCSKGFAVGTRHAGNGFCSDECSDRRHREYRAKAHQRLRILFPEKLRAQRDQYKIVNAEAHQRTVKMINDRRVAYEVAALAVARDMIPEMLATVRGYRKQTNMAVEFMRSLDINVNSMQPENDHDTLRQAQSRPDHTAEQEQHECV